MQEVVVVVAVLAPAEPCSPLPRPNELPEKTGPRIAAMMAATTTLVESRYTDSSRALLPRPNGTMVECVRKAPHPNRIARVEPPEYTSMSLSQNGYGIDKEVVTTTPTLT